MYIRSKKNDGISGSFDQSKPVIVVGSPEVLKMVTIKDFEHFTDHRTFNTGDVFDKNLFGLKGNTNNDYLKSNKIRLSVFCLCI